MQYFAPLHIHIVFNVHCCRDVMLFYFMFTNFKFLIEMRWREWRGGEGESLMCSKFDDLTTSRLHNMSLKLVVVYSCKDRPATLNLTLESLQNYRNYSLACKLARMVTLAWLMGNAEVHILINCLSLIINSFSQVGSTL